MQERTLESISMNVYQQVSHEHGSDIASWLVIYLYWATRLNFRAHQYAGTHSVVTICDLFAAGDGSANES
jgi:hypothetical protein